MGKRKQAFGVRSVSTLDFPHGSVVKKPPANAGDSGDVSLIPGLGTWEDPLQKEMATPLKYSCLENSMDRGAWQATVHKDTESQRLLSDSMHTCTRVTTLGTHILGTGI